MSRLLDAIHAPPVPLRVIARTPDGRHGADVELGPTESGVDVALAGWSWSPVALRVHDPGGAPTPRRDVFVHWNAGQPEVERWPTTDGDGRVTLLVPGAGKRNVVPERDE